MCANSIVTCILMNKKYPFSYNEIIFLIIPRNNFGSSDRQKYAFDKPNRKRTYNSYHLLSIDKLFRYFLPYQLLSVSLRHAFAKVKFKSNQAMNSNTYRHTIWIESTYNFSIQQLLYKKR